MVKDKMKKMDEEKENLEKQIEEKIEALNQKMKDLEASEISTTKENEIFKEKLDLFEKKVGREKQNKYFDRLDRRHLRRRCRRR